MPKRFLSTERVVERFLGDLFQITYDGLSDEQLCKSTETILVYFLQYCLVSSLELRTVVKESINIGAILLVMYAIGAVMNAMSDIALFVRTGDFVREGFILAGTSVAILYVLLRSIALARNSSVGDVTLDSDPKEFIREAVVLALPVIFWFTLAGLATALVPFDPLNAAVETIVLATTRTGVLTAVLYVLARSGAVLLASDSSGRVVPADE